jgi:hypothetical protein
MPRKTNDTNLRLRVERELLAKLEAAREKSGRTLSGEITRRIEASFVREKFRASGIEQAAHVIETMADMLSDIPPDKAKQHVAKLAHGLKGIAFRLRQEEQGD